MSPKIFNVVMDAVIRHWVTVVYATKAGTEGLGTLVQEIAAHFYAENGLITSTKPERLQRALNVLTYLFDRVSLRKNIHKTVRMACQP